MRIRWTNVICTAFLAAAAILLSAPGAFAQYRASVQGTIVDPQNKAIPGAAVTLTDLETNRVLTAVSGETGAYRIGGLPPSHYQLAVEKEGFKKKVLANVEVLGEQENAVNVVLEVGTASETVTVSADVAPVLDTENAQLGTTISTMEVQNMPAPGRDVYQILQLAPGAFGDGAQSAGGGVSNLPGNNGPGGAGPATGIFAIENSPQVSIGGGRREVNNYQIDGIGVTSVAWAGTAIITPNMDSVKEVNVVTNNYDAEDGRYSGGQVKVTSQNGTNSYHGSFFWRAARPGLNAYQKYDGVGNSPMRNNTQLNDFGGSVGAPIVHNKLFGFFSYETIKTNGAANAQGWWETPDYRALAPANSAAKLFMSYNGAAPINGVAIPDQHTCADIGLTEGENCKTYPGGLDIGGPLTTALGTSDPGFEGNGTPGVGGGLDGVADLVYLNQNYTSPTNEQQFNGRLDYNLSQKDLLAVVGYYVPNRNNSYNGAARPMNAFVSEFQNRSLTMLWDHTFSGSMQNEFRANNGGWIWNSMNSNPNAPFGLPIIQLGNLQGVNSIGSIGSPNNFGVGSPAEFNQSTYAGKDVLTKVYKTHTLKLGGEVSRLLFLDASPWSARPTYNFNNMWDMLNDAPVSESATFSAQTGVPTDFRRDTRETLYGFFAQDSYKVKPNLTLSLGLRYEYFGPMSEKYGHLAVVELGQGTSEITGVHVRKGGNLFQADKADFGPQFGFNWLPGFGKQRLVLRGGIGLGYTGMQEANTLDGRNNPPYLAGNLTLIGNQILYGPSTFPGNSHSFYGYAANPAATAPFDPTTNLPVPGQNFALTPLQAFQAKLPTTRALRYSLDVEYDLGHQWVATLGYQGTQTRHQTRLFNYTLYDYAKFSAQGNGMDAFNPSVQSMNMYDDEGSSGFNGGLAGIRHRFGQQFELEGDIRLAKGLDDGSNNYAPAQGGTCSCGSASGAYEYFPMNLNRGPSDFDVKTAEKLYGVWTPTFFASHHGLAEKLLGAWTLSGILNAHSGFPFTVVDGNTGGDAVYQGSGSNYGGGSPLRPFHYTGGFKPGNFKTQASDGLTLFPVDESCYTAGPTMADIVNGVAQPGPIPCAPAIGRNSFRGPHYFDVDATIGKSFGLPEMKVLGGHGSVDIHANMFNLFNNVNLTNIDNNTQDPHFGLAQGALGSRTIDLQARFSF